MMKPSPLAPKYYTHLSPIEGVYMQTIEAGIRYSDRHDVLLMVFDQKASVAGVFTTSKCPSAPVEHCKRILPSGVAKALIVNSGNANAFTGIRGLNSTIEISHVTGKILDCSQDEIYLASTGVIGEPLDADKITSVLPELIKTLVDDHWLDAARTIMTTDTYPKLATQSFYLKPLAQEHTKITINGIAKGSGMIMPDMATMLAFIITDANIAPDVLQTLLSQSVEKSFNVISVDSDTSTSDTVLLFATGKKGPKIKTVDDPLLQPFSEALHKVTHDLAMQIIRDGEGASKHIQIDVVGAVSNSSAKKIALSIANSPLVKTAMAGEDANWGRVVMAIGKAGETADRDKIAIWFGDVRVAFAGERDPHYSEEEVAAIMKNDDIFLKVNLGLGIGQARVWTCDLTREYVAINGDYRS